MSFLKIIIGVVESIQMNFIGVVYWMCVWVEKIRRTFKENVKKGIKVEFVQFVKTIGLELVSTDVPLDLVMVFFTTL